MKFTSSNKKAKIYLALYVVFVFITFFAAAYVIFNGGNADAGLTVVPMLFGLVFSNLFHQEKNK